MRSVCANKFYILFLIVICFPLLSVCSCDNRANIRNINSNGREVVAFGDSLTLGVGVSMEENYPYLLGEKLGITIINAGVSGDTTRAAVKRIDRDVLSLDPRVVIVELGANDYFQKIPLDETLTNIGTIIDQIHHQGAIAVLVAVKTELMADSYGEAYKELAKLKGALFVPNIMKGILTDPALKVDRIHPNVKGYTIIAERIYKEIKFLFE